MNLTNNLLSKEVTLTVLRRALLVSAGAYLLAAGAMGGGAFYSSRKASQAEKQAKASETETFEARKLVTRGRATRDVEALQGLDGVAAFQTAVVRTASQYNCQLGEFRSSQEVVAFASRYGSAPPAGQWGQVDVQLELQGHALDVARVLRAWSEGEVPIEFDSLELARVGVSSTGQAQVSGKISLRVIVAMEKKA